jgi:hypothetical protein
MVKKFRVWHIPQIPMKPYHVEVSSVQTGVLVLRTLADYDLFQYENKIKPDYANAQGLEVFEDGEWVEYDPEDEGFDHLGAKLSDIQESVDVVGKAVKMLEGT